MVNRTLLGAMAAGSALAVAGVARAQGEALPGEKSCEEVFNEAVAGCNCTSCGDTRQLENGASPPSPTAWDVTCPHGELTKRTESHCVASALSDKGWTVTGIG